MEYKKLIILATLIYYNIIHYDHKLNVDSS